MSKKISLDKLISFQTRKSIHVNLTRDAHAGLKIACIKRGLSFQEVFDEISQLIAADNSDMIAITSHKKEHRKYSEILLQIADFNFLK